MGAAASTSVKKPLEPLPQNIKGLGVGAVKYRGYQISLHSSNPTTLQLSPAPLHHAEAAHQK